MQKPKALLTILGKMALKPEVKFDNLFPKLYNAELWLLAYQNIASKPGNMTAGIDGKTIDGFRLELIHELIVELKTSRYIPKPVRRVYLPKSNGKVNVPLEYPRSTTSLFKRGQTYPGSYLRTSLRYLHGFRPNEVVIPP